MCCHCGRTTARYVCCVAVARPVASIPRTRTRYSPPDTGTPASVRRSHRTGSPALAVSERTIVPSGIRISSVPRGGTPANRNPAPLAPESTARATAPIWRAPSGSGSTGDATRCTSATADPDTRIRTSKDSPCASAGSSFTACRNASDDSRGWLVASWLIGHAQTYGIRSVTFAGKRWSADSGAWTDHPSEKLVVTING